MEEKKKTTETAETPAQKLEKGEFALKELRWKLSDWTKWWKTQIGWEDQTIDGANQYIPKEFWSNLNDWMYPYVHRLMQDEYITTSMAYEFLGQCEEALMDLRTLAHQADWEWEFRQKSLIDRLLWRWKTKRFTKYGYADFKRLSTKDVFVPLI